MIVIEVSKKPVGSYFGGKYPRSIRCGKCGAPGLLVYRKQDRWTTIVHTFTIDLNKHKEAELTEVEVC